VIVENKRKWREKGPWAKPRFIITGHVLDETEEKHKNQLSVKIVGVLTEI
jgi:hypothetical protein